MKHFLCSLFIWPLFVCAQEIQPPRWNEEKDIHLQTAKVKEFDDLSNKVKSDAYKDGELIIYCTSGRADAMKINIHDRYFLEYGSITSTAYREDEEGKRITYVIQEDKKMISVLISYKLYDPKPSSIVVVATDDYTKKPMKKITLALYELK